MLFDPNVFGMSSSEFFKLSQVLFTSTAAFVFLFLLDIPIKKFPFLESAGDYAPPPWLIPWFAGISLFLLCLTAATAGFLRYFEAHPSINDFLSQYHVERPTLTEPPGAGKLVRARITLQKADGNFGIYVNGWRAFSSETNCGLVFLCKSSDDWAKNLSDCAKPQSRVSCWEQLREELPKPSVSDYYKPGNLYRLPVDVPVRVPIEQWLTSGDNFIDVHTSYPGRGECSLQGTLRLEFQAKSTVQAITSNAQSAAANIAKYRTYAGYLSHRICGRERIRLILP
jgi:hypothetical protein